MLYVFGKDYKRMVGATNILPHLMFGLEQSKLECARGENQLVQQRKAILKQGKWEL